jgi:tRNA nucleotidyltransferase/poly(A) polymerase
LDNTYMSHTTTIPWSQIVAALPPRISEILIHLHTIATSHGATLYIVGGAARSVFTHDLITDLDLAIANPQPDTMPAMARFLDGTLTQHDQFATATITLAPAVAHTLGIAGIDIVPARTETYARPGALPQVTPSDIMSDLGRRDISVNAIAIELHPNHDCAIYDPFDGCGDLVRGVARILHPNSLIDDPTRIIRIARIATRLGLRIDASTRHAIRHACSHAVITHISQRRWLQELRKTMAEVDPAPALALLQRWGLLRAIHPSLCYRKRDAPYLTQIAPGYRMIILFWDAPLRHLDDIIKTWHELPVVYRQIPRLRHQKRQIGQLIHAQASAIARQLHRFDDDLLGAIAVIYPGLATLLARWQQATQQAPPTLVNGIDVLALGVPKGPRVGQILDALSLALLDQKITPSDRTGQLAWIAQQFISQSH